MARSIDVVSAAEAKSRTRRSRRPAMRGVPRARRAIPLAPSAVLAEVSTAGAARDLVGALGRHADVEHAGSAGDDLLELFLGVEIEPHRNAKTVAQRIS